MNFNSHYKEVKRLLLRPDKRKSANSNKPDQQQYYPGIYVISRDKELDKNQQLQYKIGMAWGSGGIYKRMDGYKVGFPYEDEFWMHFCIITRNVEDTKKLEKIILNYNSMEKVKNPRSTSQFLEYRIVVMKTTLQDALLKALRDHPKLWDYCVVFGLSGWKILPNTGADLIGSGALQKPADDNRARPLLYSNDKNYLETERVEMYRSITELIDIKRNLPVDINTIKKGDFIKSKKWGLAQVESVSKKKARLTVVSDTDPEGYYLFLH